MSREKEEGVSEDKPLVLYAVEGKVAIITLNRPEKRNALSRALWQALDAAFARAFDDSALRAIVLTGAGPSFCAGADIAGSEDPTAPVPWWELFAAHHRRQFALWDSGKIVIAGVNGYALGRGLELALWCDIVVAASDAKLGLPEIRQGGVLHSVIPWISGPQQAKLFLISGDTVGAAEAERLGLVAQVAPAGAGTSAAVKLAHRLSHVPAIAARAVKEMVNGVYESRGFRHQQAAGVTTSALNASLSPEERGTAELARVGREQGFKAWLKFRDAPFES
jgi:enoyl-CoA hydratase/carnithine racemase